MFLANLDAFPPDGPAVAIRAGVGSDRLDDVLARRPRRAAWVVDPRSVGDGASSIRASLAGVPVRLAPEAVWPDGVLERLADHFLHAPTLEVPVEPFATLAQTIARGRGPDLGIAFREELGRDFFVDVEGRVSLSERWAKAGRFLGTVRDTLDDFEASDLWRELAGWRKRVFADVGACATCAHYPASGGFGLADGSEADVCRGWQDALAMLADAWRAHRDERADEAR